MAPSKIDLNIYISIIYKTIKIEIHTRETQNTHKGDNKKYPQIKVTTKTKQKIQTLTTKRKSKWWGCHERKEMTTPYNNIHTREDQGERGRGGEREREKKKIRVGLCLCYSFF